VFYYTYILESLKDKSLYIGYTSNLKQRLLQHNSGKSTYTRQHLPYKLIHFEAFLHKTDAKKREVYLKSGWGFKTIKTLLSNYFSQTLPS